MNKIRLWTGIVLSSPFILVGAVSTTIGSLLLKYVGGVYIESR